MQHLRLHYFRYNIRYGRVTASDEEVEDAARFAEIHDRILTFPKSMHFDVILCFMCDSKNNN